MVKKSKPRSAPKPPPGQKSAEREKYEDLMHKPADSVQMLIGEKKLNEVYNKDQRFAEEIATLTGKKREALGNAEAKDHLDTFVFAKAKAWNKLTPEKAYASWSLFLRYLDSLGFFEKLSKVQRLDLGDGKEDGDDEDGEDGEEATERPKPTFGARTASTVKELAEKSGAAPGPGGV